MYLNSLEGPETMGHYLVSSICQLNADRLSSALLAKKKYDRVLKCQSQGIES